MQADGKEVDESVEPTKLWEAYPKVSNAEMQYNFNYFSMQLNYLPDSLRPKLPPTDSRLRPDQQAWELGNSDLASDEKNRLEDK